ncbi:hypothetical protein [Paraburkholderia sp. 7MH5]|uniref:hypothetical protein n=1 Tax=Paraburkholderia pallida TaxID=2547399 RepID=UPI00143060EA
MLAAKDTASLLHLGPLSFEYSAFAVDGWPDLSMVVYNPATAEDREKIGSALAREQG